MKGASVRGWLVGGVSGACAQNAALVCGPRRGETHSRYSLLYRRGGWGRTLYSRTLYYYYYYYSLLLLLLLTLYYYYYSLLLLLSTTLFYIEGEDGGGLSGQGVR